MRNMSAFDAAMAAANATLDYMRLGAYFSQLEVIYDGGPRGPKGPHVIVLQSPNNTGGRMLASTRVFFGDDGAVDHALITIRESPSDGEDPADFRCIFDDRDVIEIELENPPYSHTGLGSAMSLTHANGSLF